MLANYFSQKVLKYYAKIDPFRKNNLNKMRPICLQGAVEDRKCKFSDKIC